MWSVDTSLPLPVPCCHTDHHSLKSQPWVKLIWWQCVDWEQKDRAQRCHVGGLYWHCLGRLPFLISKIGLLIVDICGWMVYSSTGFISLHKYHRATPKWQVCSLTITVVKICECYTSENTRARASAFKSREQDTSQASDHCGQYLLAASPFSYEVRGNSVCFSMGPTLKLLTEADHSHHGS